MSDTKVAIICLGYQAYAVPVARVPELLAVLAEIRRMESKYEGGQYVYWPDDISESDQTITLVAASRVMSSKPQDPQPTPVVVAPAATDARVFAAPTSPEPINVKSVPPMREFVDDFRHEDFAT